MTEPEEQQTVSLSVEQVQEILDVLAGTPVGRCINYLLVAAQSKSTGEDGE